MASIIKAGDLSSLSGAGSRFNFDDMAQHADAYVRQVREQAGKIIAEARTQADQIRRQAEVDGLKAARVNMQAQIEAEATRRMEQILPALRSVVAETAAAKEAWLAKWERDGVHLATRIAERILRRELAVRPELPLVLVRESLELSASGEGVRISLHPDDLTAFGPQIEALLREMKRGGNAEVVADATIGRGGCRVETQHGAIDQRLEAQLDRIEEELT
jgi:flagellar assembly protein FliH